MYATSQRGASHTRKIGVCESTHDRLICLKIGRIPKNALAKMFCFKKLPLVSWPKSGGKLMTWRQKVDGEAILADVSGRNYSRRKRGGFGVCAMFVQPKRKEM